VTDADLLVGTSAGSVVATQVATGIGLDDLHDRQVAPGPGGEKVAELDIDAMAASFMEMMADRPDPQELRRRIGAWAIDTDTVPELERIETISARLPVHEWPERDLRITAVDAHDGRFVVFDRTSGVPLVTAVAASCAVPGVWPPVTIDGRRHVDGGVRSTVNADLASGHERVLVVCPITQGLGGDVSREVDALRADGAQVAMVAADEASVAAFGTNVLDPASRGPAAEAGLAQAASVADQVGTVWS
jgi:NTE family protein